MEIKETPQELRNMWVKLKQGKITQKEFDEYNLYEIRKEIMGKEIQSIPICPLREKYPSKKVIMYDDLDDTEDIKVFERWRKEANHIEAENYNLKYHRHLVGKAERDGLLDPMAGVDFTKYIREDLR